MEQFFQSPPQIQNTFRADPLLATSLQKICPADIWTQIKPHLDHLGERAATDFLRFSEEAEAYPPVHVPFDAWGKRIDHIQTSSGWQQLEKAAAEEGIVATAYERKQGEFSRVYQMALLYLYSPSSAFYSCPLAMTDGAARVIELSGDPILRSRAFASLTSRDPKKFWTSGQWMTEKAGGSDVSMTSTEAGTIAGASSSFGATHALNGTKWFTSATTSQMALTLARTEGAPEGSKGLSLFYLELRNSAGGLQNIQIHRLKDKLGTCALPTAELSLQGTPARQLGAIGEGVKKITGVLNITRIYNSICALGHMRRCLDLAQDYSRKRVAFGRRLIDHPLHAATLAELEADFRRCFNLCFFIAHLLGRDECGVATADERVLLRALTPVLKLYTGKKAVSIASEVVEIFGGAGYVEDTGIPRLLRDAQVFSIWEGTTNVLSLDMLRAFEREGALPVVQAWLTERKTPAAEMQQLEGILKLVHSQGEAGTAHARALAMTLAHVVAERLG